MTDVLEQLRTRIDRHTGAPRQATAIDGLTLFRQARPRPGVATMYRPSLCVVAGGRKGSCSATASSSSTKASS
jgi:hypothetical protein